VRPPNFYELYYDDGDTARASKHCLDPEKIETYELIWEQYIGKHLWVTMGGFYYHIDDLINLETDPDGFLVYRNMESVTAKGFEFELSGKWPNGIQGRLSYVLQRAEDDFGNTLTNSPTPPGKAQFLCARDTGRTLSWHTVHLHESQGHPRGQRSGRRIRHQPDALCAEGVEGPGSVSHPIQSFRPALF